jgi:alkylation response protein AidB-like acyl-CoA dehydrogenase
MPGSTYIEFDDVEVPVENLLGQENRGFEIIMSSKHLRLTPSTWWQMERPASGHWRSRADFNHERLWLAGTSLRLARVCIEDAYRYAQKRETFGKPLLENQTIRSKFSACGRRVESAQALMEQLVYVHDVSGRDGRDPYLGGQFASLKVLAGQVLEFVNREAQQTMGGLGYARGGRGARVEQISRDLRVMVVGGGSEEILTDLAMAQEVRALAKL